ncbi:MAG: class C sortase [Oscillospiraceae bacterium]|nr:class C sortase [Oscillospiraceae bacterium]
MEEKENTRGTSRQSWIRKNWSTVLIVTSMIIGVGLLAYPSFSDYWNSFHQSRAIMSYAETVSNMSSEDFEREIKAAMQYNAEIAKEPFKWKMSEEEVEKYSETLNFTGNGNMGYIVIDKIKVSLPIYHGVEENVLQTSIGHIEGSSLPVGAATYDYDEQRVMDETDGSHCVLSGHRGLPSARLFTDLDRLVEGDTFSLNVLGNTYTYQVDQIRVVEPSDLTDIQLVPGMDYCTLVTCTPYGINTHRLLVRGHRVANPQGEVTVTEDAILIDSIYVAPFIAAPIILILFIIVLFETRQPNKRKQSQ